MSTAEKIEELAYLQIANERIEALEKDNDRLRHFLKHLRYSAPDEKMIAAIDDVLAATGP